MLLQIIGLMWRTNRYLDLGLDVEPLLRLQRAISEVERLERSPACYG